MENKITYGSMIPTEEIKHYNQMISVGYPTDIIDIHDSIEAKLFEMSGVYKTDIIPNDIVMCKTISIEDVVLNEITPPAILEKLSDFPVEIIGGMDKVPIRVKLFSDWKQSVDNIISNNGNTAPLPIGAVMMECCPGIWIYKVFCISYDSLTLMDGIGYKIDSNDVRAKRVIKDMFELNIINDDKGTKYMFRRMLKLWYSVQIALLNPITVDVFSRGERCVVVEHETKKKQTKKKQQKKTKIKYVRKHIITPEDFDAAFDIKTEDGHFIRKTMIWHVAGHWREYKNGRRVFIDGYWKGPLKDIKTADSRERELVLSK